MITQQIKSIDLISVVQNEGIQLKASGKYHKGLCPFHSERTPSFVIDTDKNRFNCYGCHEYGDPVDFVQKLHGFTFQDALSYLGIELKSVSKEQFAEIKKQIAAAEKRRQRREARRQRESELAFTLGTLIRRIYKAKQALSPDNLNEFGGIYSNLSWYEWGHDKLIHGNPKDKAYVLWSFKGFPAIERGKLFIKGFDFGRWLRSLNGAKNESDTIRISFKRSETGS
jgi:hypothetical protein